MKEIDGIHNSNLRIFFSISDLEYTIFLYFSIKGNISNIRSDLGFGKTYIKHNYMIRNSFYLLDNVSKKVPEYL